MNIDDIKPGDVLEFPSGKRDYVFRMDDGCELGVNACNPLWISDGRRNYGEELYYLDNICLDGASVVDHFGDGYMEDGLRWYADNQDNAVQRMDLS